MNPHTYLRIAVYATMAAVFCLLMLFMASTPIDPVIQGGTLVFYLVAILAMGGIVHNYLRFPKTAKQAKKALTGEPDPATAAVPLLQTQACSYPGHTGQGPTRIILLTKHDHRAREIKQILSGWDLTLDQVHSCAEASQKILNLTPGQGAVSRVILVVDIQDLELDPVHLPALVKQDMAQTVLRLIGIVNSSEATGAQQLKAAGFSALLNRPIEKSQLFLALAPEETYDTQGGNVVSLARYRETQERQTRKRILLAEQHAGDRKRLASLLRASGHLVKVVENGEQALDSLEHQYFDVALINLQLPIMNGTQVIKLHRFTTPHPQWVSFIVTTDQTTPATLRLCRDLQIKACLFKPVPTTALLEIIDSAPVITPPLPATNPRQAESATTHQQETRFLHADLLDIKVLQSLRRLDNDTGFVTELIAIFSRDCDDILQRMETAVTQEDADKFIELSSILMDNAGQLGAFALYESCLTLQTMSRRELVDTLTAQLTRLRQQLERTNLAFQHYLYELENQRFDHS